MEAFVKEAERQPHYFDFQGSEYELAPQLPALVVIKASRFKRSGASETDEVAGDMMFEMLDEVFGTETLDRIVTDHHLGLEQLGDLLTAAVQSYGVGAEGNRAARRQGGRSTSPKPGRK